jgi:hypothetical protein
MVGQPVGVRAILVRTDEIVIAVVGVSAFPTGVKFNVLGMRRPASPPPNWRPFDDPWSSRHGEDGFQLRAEFADGRASAYREYAPEPGTVPSSPVILPSSGSSEFDRWNFSYWLWPLPPEGDLTFVCEWQAMGIPESRASIDATLIRKCAQEAIDVWPAEA